MITFSCPHCGRHFQVQDDLAGRRGACKTCGGPIQVPLPRTADQHPSAPTAVAVKASSPPPVTRSARHSELYPPEMPASRQPPATPKITVDLPSSPRVAAPSAVAKSPATTPDAKLPLRIRRLMADANHVQQSLVGFPLIRVLSMQGEPPERYILQYHVRSLARGPNGVPQPRDSHVVEIQLTSEYPRQCPRCRMLTPVFHPNIEPATICVGDHWTAGERLLDLIVRIGELLAYQVYNIRSPLDGEAAMWADQNRHHLPIDSRDLHPPETA